ncbi:MAG TPA: DNA-processing protein DprA [Gemmatimonadaceae bacterium]|jgi:DNA processing protein
MRIATIPSHSPEYPPQLNDLASPPDTLWAVGDLATLREPVVAIVGTRRATSYGLRIAHQLGAALARAGACVVSGLALGIDGAAHRGALESNGRTAAVLGTGVDVPYPRANLSIYREIAERGLLLSEMAPGFGSRKYAFPNRNRIIAALAKLVIVVEAPYKSGALHTSTYALEMNRDIAIVPGPIDSPQSAGSNLLLRDGAHPIMSIEDAITLAGLTPSRITGPSIDDPTEMRVWAALESNAHSLDDLCARAALPVAECMAAVTGLELRGAVECALTGEIRRR